MCASVDACVLVCVDICIHSAALSSRSHFGFQFHRHFRFNASSVICIFYLLLLSLHERLERSLIDEGREGGWLLAGWHREVIMPIISRVNCHTKFWQSCTGGRWGKRTIHLLHKFENCSRCQNNFSKVENVSHCLQVRTPFHVCVCIFMWLQQLFEMAKAFPCSIGGVGIYLEYSSIQALEHCKYCEHCSLCEYSSDS